MKSLLHLLVLSALVMPLGTHATEESVEGSRITQIAPGDISYSYFNYKPELLAFFDSRGLQGGGYTWEALAKAGLELTGGEFVALIEFDPEGDQLFANSSSRPALEHLATLVNRIAVDVAFRKECIKLAAERGWLE